jgi:hypothetical protein
MRQHIEETNLHTSPQGRGITYYARGPCPKSDGSPFQACECTNCTAGHTSATNPCASANFTTGVVFHCKSWASNPLPYGSEFSWDSTGQEEVRIHSLYTMPPGQEEVWNASTRC